MIKQNKHKNTLSTVTLKLEKKKTYLKCLYRLWGLYEWIRKEHKKVT